uniref:Uncharacterized protein n=1 Tax=Triticum urartu TaxID=4572 RepID=A0A8R7QWA9_TRIUA
MLSLDQYCWLNSSVSIYLSPSETYHDGPRNKTPTLACFYSYRLATACSPHNALTSFLFKHLLPGIHLLLIQYFPPSPTTILLFPRKEKQPSSI